MSRTKPPAAHLLASADDVEAQFYDALREADIERLMAVWHDDEEVVCVHPGGARVIGVRAIRSTFESIFANGAIPVIAEGKRSVQTLDSAVHSVVERITITSPEGLRTGFAVATNVYVKTALGWRMVAHHATPGASEAPAEISEPPTVLH
jgi:uncharacterized protein (TIGR02246 family)